VVSAPARRALVRHMVERGISERRSLRIIGMSASALRYEPAADRNCALKEKIIALAQRHRRYGAGMIYLKLRKRQFPPLRKCRWARRPPRIRIGAGLII